MHRRILNFEEKNLKAIDFYVDNMKFPVAIAAYSEWEEEQIQYLKKEIHTTESLCKWCESHNMQYRITYPLHWFDVVRNPVRYIEFLVLRRKLKQND